MPVVARPSVGGSRPRSVGPIEQGVTTTHPPATGPSASVIGAGDDLVEDNGDGRAQPQTPYCSVHLAEILR